MRTLAPLERFHDAAAAARPLRVLHVSTVHPPFDIRIFWKEARALQRAGYEVSVAMATGRDVTAEGIRVLPLGEFDGTKWRRLTRNLRAFPLFFGPYDVVHVHDPELLVLGGIAALCGRRVIYDVHEFYQEKLRGGDQNAHWLGPFRSLAAVAYKTIEDFVLKYLAGVVVVTPAMRDLYASRVRAARLVTVRNVPAIDAADIAAARSAPRPLERRYVLHTGAASRARAFHVLVEAAEMLAAFGSDAVVVNLGTIYLDGYSEAERTSLLERARRAGIVMPGRVGYEECLRWLAHAAVGYLPLTPSANYGEALPTKLFEYFSFGLPIVAADIGVTGDLVRRHDAGMLVPHDDPAEHAAAFHLLLDDPERAAAFGGRGLRAAEQYTFGPEAQALCELYRHIVHG